MQMYQRFKKFAAECRRVLKVTRKPTWPEFSMLSKVTGLGLLVIGLIGFLLSFAKQLALTLLG